MITCASCNETKPASEFGSRPRRRNGLDPRCKDCLSEAVKRAYRLNQALPRYLRLTETWSVQHLESEIEWLEAKLLVCREELRTRGKVT